ncbi:RsiV family protein [Hymenobacter sp.]|uniref:RsiV family protein n=1 Tax=Hymenobacter sp. TaxID=1898978 RepID=UPI0039C8B03A
MRRHQHQPATKLDEFLFMKKMPVSHNIFLTSSGAVFIYTPYEIASFAQGEIRLFIPLKQLRPFIKSDLPWGREEVSQR